MLIFELVNFSIPYHIILGRPCYVKFMAIRSYAYLKLKIPGPTSVITMEAKSHWALNCEQNNIELSTTTVAAVELKELCLSAPPSSTGPTMPSTPGSFKAAKNAKAMQIDTEDPAKTIHVEADLCPK
jgi:hypothetical protein